MDRLGGTYNELRQQVDKLGDFYEAQGQRIERLGNLYDIMHEQHSNQLEIIDAQLEGLWAHLVPPPPSPPYALGEAPPRPPYRHPPCR